MALHLHLLGNHSATLIFFSFSSQVLCVCVVLGPTGWATPPTLFCDSFYWDRVSRTICLGWLQTGILLISASWVARITGVSHWCPALHKFLKEVCSSCLHFLVSDPLLSLLQSSFGSQHPTVLSLDWQWLWNFHTYWTCLSPASIWLFSGFGNSHSFLKTPSTSVSHPPLSQFCLLLTFLLSGSFTTSGAGGLPKALADHLLHMLQQFLVSHHSNSIVVPLLGAHCDSLIPGHQVVLLCHSLHQARLTCPSICPTNASGFLASIPSFS
jgi:hypothetical protein